MRRVAAVVSLLAVVGAALVDAAASTPIATGTTTTPRDDEPTLSMSGRTTGTTGPSDVEPTGVHLALGDDDYSMSVTWATRSPAASVVEFGRATVRDTPTVLSSRASGTSTRFVDDGPEHLVRVVHQVVLKDLEPGVKYEYRAGDASKPGGTSRRFFFYAKRSPAQMLAGPPLKMLAMCDVGHLESRGVLSLVEDELRNDAAKGRMPDALIHCGDLAYDLDTSNGRNGDAFLRDIEPIAAYVPYMISAGNHERAGNFSHYTRRFLMPGHGRRTGNHYYSLDIGPVHLVAYNGEAFFYPEYFDADYIARMHDWLEDDLRAANRNRAKTPWWGPCGGGEWVQS